MSETTETQTQVNASKPGNKSKFIPLVIIVSIALGICVWFNRGIIADVISSFFYHPSAEVADIIDKIGLNYRSNIIFKATAPSLDNRDDFNKHCKSHDQDISVLGCYTGGQIYIYNIENSDLNGVVESTAAHELLHAVWHRLGNSEKEQLSKQLLEVYNDSRYHDLLADDLETYNDSERIDELHSRIGTEIADLPEALEKHYARYFNNQDLVVDYYNSYIEPFKELEAEIDSLSSQLKNLNAEIESKTSDYYRRFEELSAKISEFNRCASTAGCFTLESVFNVTRNNLLSEQSSLGASFDELNALIDKYNNVVMEYNENVLRGAALEKAINSNAEPEMIKNS